METAAAGPAPGVVERIRTWGRLVKFPHTVFALPFAFSGAALAAVDHGIGWAQVGWIVLAMVGARNAAMGFNRLADHAIDARNPRTASRELPSGRLSRASVWAGTLSLTALFVLAAHRLDVLWLTPIALVVVFGYSYTKRFTWACHFVLGAALALAPVGGWVALGAGFSWTIVALAGSVMAWVAGFDVVYACQDEAFDRKERLHAIPARFGIPAALVVARLLHAIALAGLAAVGLLADLPPIYAVGWTIVAAILVWEHRLVRADDLSRLDMAFFNANGLIAAVYFVTVLGSVLWGGR